MKPKPEKPKIGYLRVEGSKKETPQMIDFYWEGTTRVVDKLMKAAIRDAEKQGINVKIVRSDVKSPYVLYGISRESWEKLFKNRRGKGKGKGKK